MSEEKTMSSNTVGSIGAHDIGKEVILQHGDSHIRGILRNITHDVEVYESLRYNGDRVDEFYVTTTLDISGVVVYGLVPDTAISKPA